MLWFAVANAAAPHDQLPPACATMLPPEQRQSLPELPALTGLLPTDRFSMDDLSGKVGLLLAWYEW